MRKRLLYLVAALAASSPAAAKDGGSSLARDFKAHPAILEIDDADDIYAVSDPHGGYAELGTLLAKNKLISNFSTDPAQASKATWTGGSATLVVAGDIIDKGAESLGVIDLLRAIETSAAKSGGHVVVTLGNHEAEFLADPHNKKATSTGDDATGIDNELAAQKIDPDELASGRDKQGRGRWLMDRPLGVRVKKWFFAHGGNTNGDSLSSLDKRLQKALSDKGFGAKDITGDDSILEAQQWYGDPDKGKGHDYAKALGVNHIAFGHDPGALGKRGSMVANKDGSLVKLDVMMGLKEKKAVTSGLLLHVRTKGDDVAEVLDAKGNATPLSDK